ncbi:histidine N-alpha-methyltransferase-like [Ylistrum balloti]|uniref:histidine N-alpha-methyltransferase-like n=1 Tax=Ylistrum balloti TaxID=509963 RepID=UPI002905EA14|nr:histidine N-alpha-methyltransferase-like [Ylistrum balloti]
MGETPQKGVLVAGLMSKPKYIPTWYNYDKTGSELQHQCATENAGKNYFTRCQMSILQDHIQDIIPRLPNELILVDIGSGNCSKSKICIDELIERQGKCSFYPVDISKEFLLQSASKLSNEYGAAVNITPIPKDFEQGIEQLRSVEGPKLVLFLSTLMIMSYDDQVNILRKISTILTGFRGCEL